MYSDARALPQRDGGPEDAGPDYAGPEDGGPEQDSPQDPSWFFDKSLRPDQRTPENAVPRETVLKEQDSAKGPNSFFDQIVKRVRGTTAKESSGEEAQALLTRAKAKEQATREAEEKLESEMKVAQVATEKSKVEEQAARELIVLDTPGWPVLADNDTHGKRTTAPYHTCQNNEFIPCEKSHHLPASQNVGIENEVCYPQHTFPV